MSFDGFCDNNVLDDRLASQVENNGQNDVDPQYGGFDDGNGGFSTNNPDGFEDQQEQYDQQFVNGADGVENNNVDNQFDDPMQQQGFQVDNEFQGQEINQDFVNEFDQENDQGFSDNMGNPFSNNRGPRSAAPVDMRNEFIGNNLSNPSTMNAMMGNMRVSGNNGFGEKNTNVANVAAPQKNKIDNSRFSVREKKYATVTVPTKLTCKTADISDPKKSVFGKNIVHSLRVFANNKLEEKNKAERESFSIKNGTNARRGPVQQHSGKNKYECVGFALGEWSINHSKSTFQVDIGLNIQGVSGKKNGTTVNGGGCCDFILTKGDTIDCRAVKISSNGQVERQKVVLVQAPEAIKNVNSIFGDFIGTSEMLVSGLQTVEGKNGILYAVKENDAIMTYLQRYIKSSGAPFNSAYLRDHGVVNFKKETIDNLQSMARMQEDSNRILPFDAKDEALSIQAMRVGYDGKIMDPKLSAEKHEDDAEMFEAFVGDSSRKQALKDTTFYATVQLNIDVALVVKNTETGQHEWLC